MSLHTSSVSLHYFMKYK